MPKHSQIEIESSILNSQDSDTFIKVPIPREASQEEADFQAITNALSLSEVAAFDPFALAFEDARNALEKVVETLGETLLARGRKMPQFLFATEAADQSHVRVYMLGPLAEDVSGAELLNSEFARRRVDGMVRGRDVRLVQIEEETSDTSPADAESWPIRDIRRQMLASPETMLPFFNPLLEENTRLRSLVSQLQVDVAAQANSAKRLSQEVLANMAQRQEIEKAEQRRGFVEDMHHKLKNPLSEALQDIKVVCRLLEKTVPEDERNTKSNLAITFRTSTRVQSATKRAISLLEQLSEPQTLTSERKSVLDALASFSDTVSAFARETPVLENALAGGAQENFVVPYSAEGMNDIWEELISNARRFEAAERRLAFETASKIGTANFNLPNGAVAWLHLVFADNGQGVPPDKKYTIFLPGFSTREGGKGGRGLNYCLKIVNEMDGHIFEDGEYGLGSQFNIVLPIYET